MVSLVHHVRHGLFGNACDSPYGGQFHFFVDGRGSGVQRATEDIRESDDVVNLVRIVGTSGSHQHVGTRIHGIFIRDFGYRVSQCEYDGRRSHAAHHVLAQHIAARQAEEYVGALDGFFQRMDVRTTGGEVTLLLVQVGTVF